MFKSAITKLALGIAIAGVSGPAMSSPGIEAGPTDFDDALPVEQSTDSDHLPVGQSTDSDQMAPIMTIVPPPEVDPSVTEAFGLALRDSNEDPTHLAGAFIDVNTGNLVLAGVDADVLEAARARSISRAPDARVQIVTRLVQRSQADLVNITNTVNDVGPAAGQVNAASVHFATNQAVLSISNPTPSIRASLYQLYGDAVTIRVGAPVVSQPMYGDTSPFWGGSEIGFTSGPSGGSAAKICESGFAWEAPNGQDTLVTAGHCVAQNTTTKYAWTDRPSGSSCFRWCYYVGVAGSSTYKDGVGSVPYNGGDRGDIGFINISGGKTSSGRIYLVDGGTAPVVDAVHPYTGMPTCITQIAHGNRNCTFYIQDTVATYYQKYTNYPIKNVMWSLGEQWCGRFGDSGGPVYLDDGIQTKVTAAGIHSGGAGGGSDGWGGAFDKCESFDTNIHNVTDAFGGQLKKNG